MGGHILNLKCYYLDLAEVEEPTPQLSYEAILNEWEIRDISDASYSDFNELF